ncbi:hypothetical protein O3M35_000772 [Rhynocoris fuscipes]|uniref:Uncharacterized protein n=1 Tax=Rhynocoris fuscipes TaxID=488301 RepID=A0AAW1D2M9_9HEMI
MYLSTFLNFKKFEEKFNVLDSTVPNCQLSKPVFDIKFVISDLKNFYIHCFTSFCVKNPVIIIIYSLLTAFLTAVIYQNSFLTSNL